MPALEFEVYYKHTPTHSDPFPLEPNDVVYNLKMLSNDLSHFLPDAKVTVTHEDYDNHRIQIRIESEAAEQDVVSEVMRALCLSHLLGRRI